MAEVNIEITRDKYRALDDPEVDALQGNIGIRDAFWGDNKNNEGWVDSEIFFKGDEYMLIHHEERPALKHLDIVMLRTEKYDVLVTIGMSCFSHVNKTPLRELMMVFDTLDVEDIDEVAAFHQDAISLMYAVARAHLDGTYIDFGHDISFSDEPFNFYGRDFQSFAFARNPFADNVFQRFNIGELSVNGESKVIDVEFLHIIPLYEEEGELYRTMAFNVTKEADKALKSLLEPVITKLSFDAQRKSFAE